MWVAVSRVCCCSNIPVRTVQVLAYFGNSPWKLVMIATTNPAMLNINCICMLHLYCIVPLAGLISPPSCPCRFRIASTSPTPTSPSTFCAENTRHCAALGVLSLPAAFPPCWTWGMQEGVNCSHKHVHLFTYTHTHTDPGTHTLPHTQIPCMYV